MSESILSMLYHGQLCPEESIVSGRKEYRQITDKASEFDEQMHNTFPPAYGELLQQFQDLDSQAYSYLMEATFIAGFKLGARTMQEILDAD